jgi:hypothetical protein
MSAIKSFFTMIDIFGVNYNFRYKDKEKYQTALGGFIVILFAILAITMAIYYFIPFVNRKNYTIVYYTMNLAKTEEVDLFASESNFAVGLICEKNKKETRKIDELLDLKSRYVEYVKSRDGNYAKNPKDTNIHLCTYDDFYNKYDAQFDYLSSQTYYCVGNKEYTIQGIYADQVFSYFEFSVVAKDTTKAWTDEVLRFLFHNDCKLQIAFTDIIIDLDNYENPITQYLNTIFIQLNPSLFIKRNIYFMNQHFTNDDFLMFVFGDDQTPEKKPLYSRYEEYALWKGLKRFEEQPAEYEYYSKVYIRAELKKTVIKRKYQKFMEFYADASSLLIAIFEILVVIFNYVDTFYAHHSLAKSTFFFKELEDKDNFNIMKKTDIIQELISITELQKKNSENSPIEIISKNSKIMKNFPPKKKETERQEINDDKEDNQKEIKVYNNRNKRPLESKQTKSSSYLKGKSTEEKKDYNNSKQNQYSEKSEDDRGESDENYPKYKMNQMKRNRNSGAMLNFRYNDRSNDDYNESIGTNMDENSSDTERPRRKRKLKVENDFNIIEIIITQIFKCCMTKSMRLKNDANEKANELLFKKMDINAYVRNSILFDVMNRTMIDDNTKPIFNFLSRPVISVNKKAKVEFNEFYKNYRERDFNKYYDRIQEMVHKPKKEEREEKLVSISNEQLKSFVF